jgi:hypothetical protein
MTILTRNCLAENNKVKEKMGCLKFDVDRFGELSERHLDSVPVNTLQQVGEVAVFVNVLLVRLSG